MYYLLEEDKNIKKMSKLILLDYYFKQDKFNRKTLENKYIKFSCFKRFLRISHSKYRVYQSNKYFILPMNIYCVVNCKFKSKQNTFLLKILSLRKYR